jgi:hypothetical protein
MLAIFIRLRLGQVAKVARRVSEFVRVRVENNVYDVLLSLN